jgi:hypothetical protein
MEFWITPAGKMQDWPLIEMRVVGHENADFFDFRITGTEQDAAAMAEIAKHVKEALEKATKTNRGGSHMKITDQQLENWFTYHTPSLAQLPKYAVIRQYGKELARVIIENCPEGEDAAGAVWKVREAVFLANAAIATEEPEIGQSA